MKVNKVIVCLLGISVILNAAIAIVGPFFPPEAEKKELDLTVIGYIFSAYPMAFVVVSLIMPTILHYVNQRAVFVISSIIYALAVGGFGSIVFMDKNSLIIFGLLFRVLQGSANAAIYTTTYSIFSAEYDGKDFMKVNSIFKGTIGGGLLLGLLIGTILYIIGGYFLPFLVYSIFMLCLVPFGARLIPSKPAEANALAENQKEKASDFDLEINQGSNKAQEELESMPEFKRQVNVAPKKKGINPFKIAWGLLKNKVILKCILLAIIDLMLLNFSPAILSRRLSEMSVSKKLYGLFFALPFIFPIMSGLIVVKLMGKVDSHILLCIGKLFMGFGFLLIGPSYLWDIQENIWVMLTGISILGFSASFAIIPLMPIIMDEIKEKFHDRQQNYIDTASSLYNSAFGLGSILGPMLGAHLNSYFGFRICTDILSHFSALVFLVLLVTGYYYKIFNYMKKRLSEKKRVILVNQENGRSSIGAINGKLEQDTRVIDENNNRTTDV